MEIETVLGGGTTFRVFFPAVEPTLASVVKAPLSLVTPCVGTILFVDDDAALRQLGKLTLETSGFSVLLAKDGREAVDIFKENASRISTVLLDLTMPIMGGKEAFALIRDIQSDVPVIIMSGFSEDTAMEDLSGPAVTVFFRSHTRLQS